MSVRKRKYRATAQDHALPIAKHARKAVARTSAHVAGEQQEQAGQSRQPKGLLDLPGELRNQIYEYLLVGQPFVIVARPKKKPETYGDLDTLPGYFREEFRNAATLSRPVQKRSCWLTDVMPALRQIEPNGIMGGVKPFRCSYELRGNQGIALNLFLVNKQIHREASGIFFEQNIFSFETRWEDMCFAPLTFINDQTMARTMIRSLHLDMNVPPPYCCWDFRERRVASDRRGAIQISAPSNYYWKMLMDEISKLPLRHFGLTIHGSVPQGLETEFEEKVRMFPWINTLLKLGPFQSSCLDIQCCPWYDENFQLLALPSTVAFVEGVRMAWMKDNSLDGKAEIHVSKLVQWEHGNFQGCHMAVNFGEHGAPYAPSPFEDKDPVIMRDDNLTCEEVNLGDWRDRIEELQRPDFWEQ